MTQVAQTEMGGSSSGERYIDTDKMAECISNIEKAISAAELAIEEYSPTAPSLGNSTARPDVEDKLSAIKASYTSSLIPLLKQLHDDINSVKDEYITRSTSISNVGTSE